jgi:pyruvate dehydrogenase E1 component
MRTHPDMPEGSAEGILRGMYLFRDAGKPKKGELRVQLMGSGTILCEVIAAAELLEKDFGVQCERSLGFLRKLTRPAKYNS